MAPQWGRLIDKVVPWLGQLCGLLLSLTAMVVALAAAHISVGAVCVAIVLYDCGQQLFQVSSSYRIAGLDPKARARLNGCYLLAVFAGQVREIIVSRGMSEADGLHRRTAIFTKIYNSHGWYPTGAGFVGFVVAGLVVLFARGPHESHWLGWRGGAELLRREKLTDLSPHAVTEKTKARVHSVDMTTLRGGVEPPNCYGVGSEGEDGKAGV